jgi:hypothetical protein
MKTKLFLGIQVVAGLLLVLFGLNGFLQFLAMPPANEQMSAFTYAVYNTGYIFPLMAFVMLLSGLSFVLNKYTTLTAILVMPFILNAFLAHIFLDVKGIAPSAFIVIALIIVMIKNKTSYALIFKV